MWLSQELLLCTTEICLNRDLKIKPQLFGNYCIARECKVFQTRKAPDFSEAFVLVGGSIQFV
jgi:hypothetical protein